MTLTGIEGTFIIDFSCWDSWAWRKRFHGVALKEELQYLIPERTERINMDLLYDDRLVKFYFYDKDENLICSKIFAIDLKLGNEVTADH